MGLHRISRGVSRLHPFLTVLSQHPRESRDGSHLHPDIAACVNILRKRLRGGKHFVSPSPPALHSLQCASGISTPLVKVHCHLREIGHLFTALELYGQRVGQF